MVTVRKYGTVAAKLSLGTGLTCTCFLSFITTQTAGAPSEVIVAVNKFSVVHTDRHRHRVPDENDASVHMKRAMLAAACTGETESTSSKLSSVNLAKVSKSAELSAHRISAGY